MKCFVLGALVLVAACGDDSKTTEARPFALGFDAIADGVRVACGTSVTGLGPAASTTVSVGDLRFYVSNVQLFASNGAAVGLTLDTNEFQYASPAGDVALIDLTGTNAGSCASGEASQEATARTNTRLLGTTDVGRVARITFDVGVPQAVMRDVIANNSAEGAPSPLGEMYWSWASGYRHFVMNFDVTQGDTTASGATHIGSVDCGAAGGKALSDREACTYVNTPAVDLAIEDFSNTTITVDIPSLLAGQTFRAADDTLGVECHSGPTQPDCQPLFRQFGLSIANGTSNAQEDAVFGVR